MVTINIDGRSFKAAIKRLESAEETLQMDAHSSAFDADAQEEARRGAIGVGYILGLLYQADQAKPIKGKEKTLPRAVIIGEDKRGRLISTPVPPNLSNDLAHQLADSDGFAEGRYRVVSRQKAINVASEIVRAANARCS